MEKILIPYSFYEKTYIEETDTCIYELKINNTFYDILINITTSDYCDVNKAFTKIEILSKDITQFFCELGEKGLVEARSIAEEFLTANDLLLYVKGFGMPSFNSNIYINQSKPTINYDRSNYSSEDR